jgi:pimeloyl-ACP methyl ester carboxylesterase
VIKQALALASINLAGGRRLSPVQLADRSDGAQRAGVQMARVARRVKYALAACLNAAVAACVPQAPPPTSEIAPAFVEKVCPASIAAAGARCGSVRVPEDRATPQGRAIDLNVIVLAATPGDPLPPIFDIDGGPGLPATKNVEFYSAMAPDYRRGRDIVLVDQRGTGGSNGLHCPELAAPAMAHREMLPVDAVDRCRRDLVSRADLRHYGTDAAVADLDAVRGALGYKQIDIFALSYGTTVALRYMAQFPQRVRATVLMAFAPPTAMPPKHHATAGQRALDLLLGDCAADEKCRQAFPEPRRDLQRAVERLSLSASKLKPEVFLERLRSLMYSPAGARRLPWIVSRAGAGDFQPFFQATTQRSESLLADGMFLSVTCSEGLALMPFAQASAAARATIFGDYRLRRQRAACKHWPEGKVAPDFLSPVRSNAPVLLISGYLDPATPPEWAEALRLQLPNSRHLVLRHSGHIFDGLSGAETCLDPLILAFLRNPDPALLDVRCISDMRPPPFKTQ